MVGIERRTLARAPESRRILARAFVLRAPKAPQLKLFGNVPSIEDYP